MRLLLASPFPATGPYGHSRVIRGVAHGLRSNGHEVTLIGSDELGVSPASWVVGRPALRESLRAYLLANASKYDVVEYDHEYLPYPRSTFDPSVLFVARAALLQQHAEWVRFPRRRTLRSVAVGLVRGRAHRAMKDDYIRVADVTMQNADMVNVGNDDDRVFLERRGFARERIVVAPYAVASELLPLFAEKGHAEPPKDPVIAFVGTFDFRKGAVNFPGILRRVVARYPNVRLRLLGTRGLFSDEKSVLSFFKGDLRSRVEVVPTFEPVALPSLLEGSSVGIFPSYWEGFGFGVLEMMAASIPVVAFDAPGPPMMVPRDLLVAPGDEAGMANLVIGLLGDRQKLRAERERASKIAERFRWETIGEETAAAYEAGRRKYLVSTRAGDQPPPPP